METPHFTLKTDLGASDAKHAGAALEITRDALVSAAWPKYPFRDVKTEVYVLANGLDFERYFGRRLAGFFLPGSPPRFFLYGSPSRWELRTTDHRGSRSTLRHEMTHQLSREVWPHQTRWFAEGLANFLEPTYYSEDETNVVVGAVNFDGYFEYRGVRSLGIADAFAWTADNRNLPEKEVQGLYGLSWLMVHWLFNTHPEQLGKYLDLLRTDLPPDEALKIALPDLDPSELDRELHEYQKHGHFDETPRPLVRTALDENKLPERLLDQQEVADVKQLFGNISKGSSSSHTESEESPPSEGARSRMPPAKRAGDGKRIDYEALPPLPQYPCPKDGDTTSEAKPSGAPAETSKTGKKPAPMKEKPGAKEATNGRLPPEVIQKIIRKSYMEVQRCYTEGLGRNAKLGGRVSVRFVIERDGTVRDPEARCTSMADPETVRCIVENFRSLKFPQPDGGIVTVTYPMMLSPQD